MTLVLMIRKRSQLTMKRSNRKTIISQVFQMANEKGKMEESLFMSIGNFPLAKMLSWTCSLEKQLLIAQVA